MSFSNTIIISIIRSYVQVHCFVFVFSFILNVQCYIGYPQYCTDLVRAPFVLKFICIEYELCASLLVKHLYCCYIIWGMTRGLLVQLIDRCELCGLYLNIINLILNKFELI